MFCAECGAKNDEGVQFCAGCGAPTGQTNEQQSDEISGGVLNLGGVVTFDATYEENAKLIISDKPIKTILIFQVLSALLLLSLILPFFRYGYGFGIGETHNALTITFGIGDLKGNSTLVGIFSILIPIAVCALFQFQKLMPFIKGKLFICATVLNALGFIVMFIFKSSANSQYLPFNFVSGSLGFWLSTFLYLIATAVSAGFLTASMNKQEHRL